MACAAGDIRRAGGERVFVDCNVRQICVEIGGSFDSLSEMIARAGSAAHDVGRSESNSAPKPINVGQRGFESGQFQGWIKGTT
jgi:hypothetical protein